MQHTLVAVYDNRNDAQQALDDLVASGFSRQDVRLSEGDATAQASAASADQDESFGASIKNFFSDIFGSERSDHTRLYADAVTHGHYVLTVRADSEPEVERAADIVERYGPVDIDEQSEQWGGSSAAGATGVYQSGLGAQQQGYAPSQQSTAGLGLGSVQGSVQGGLQGAAAQGSALQGSTLQGESQGSTLQGSALQDSQQRGTETTIPVIQEELRVGKRAVEKGGVRIYQRVVETPVSESIGLREEHVNVERRPVDQPASAADLNAFQETTIELRETAEEAVVQKSARVVEEVVVGTEVTQREQAISDTVRRTEVEVERLTPDDDQYFRSHWQSNFASAGGNYDDYAPAYSYGNSMARNEQYRGRAWNDVESNLRTDWESRYPGSTWDKMKAAVRHGWERITS